MDKTRQIRGLAAGAALAVFAVMAQGCNEAYNPSFRNLFGDSDDAIKRGAMPRGPGWFAWDISWEGDIDEDRSAITVTETPGGQNLLTLPANWATSGVTSNTDQIQLEADTYYLQIYLVKDTAYVLENKIITIRKDKTFSFEKAFTTANGYWIPYPQVTVKAMFASDAPVTPTRAAFAFYSDAECTTPLPERGGVPRSATVSSLSSVVESDGWTALDPGSTSGFYVKVSLTDTQGRVFHRVRGPYTPIMTAGTPVEIAVGAATAANPDPMEAAFPFTLLRKIEVDPMVLYGTFVFKQTGSDGKEYTAAAGYQGAEAADDWPGTGPVQISEAGVTPGKALNVVQVSVDPPLDAANPLTDTGTGIEFKMPRKGPASLSVAGIRGVFSNAGAVSLAEPTVVTQYDTIDYGFKESLCEAINPSGGQTAVVTILTDINAEVNASGKFIRPSIAGYTSATTITIPATSDITLTVPADQNWKIAYASLARFFMVYGKLTLSAGNNGSLTLDGGDNNADDALIWIERSSPVDPPDVPALTMNDGVTIKNAAGAAGNTRALELKADAVFTMAGGKISGCSEAVVVAGGTFEMGGGANIPKGASPARNGIKYTSAASPPLKITGALSSGTQGGMEIAPYAYSDSVQALTNGTADDYTYFCVRPNTGNPDPGVEKPYIITETGYLYGPEAKTSAPLYYQYLKDAVAAASGSSTIILLKSIELHEGISVPAAASVTVQQNSAGISMTRGAALLEPLFTVSGALKLTAASPFVIDGNAAVTTTHPIIQIYSAGTLELLNNVEIKNNSAAAVHSAGRFTLNTSSLVNVNNVVELEDGKTIEINASGGPTGTSLAKIKPVYPASNAQTVLSGTPADIAATYGCFPVVPQTVSGGSIAWLVDSAGKLYYKLTVNLSLPPGASDFTLTVPAAGRIARGSAVIVNTSGITLDAAPLMEINGVSQTVSWSSPNAQITVPAALAYGQHTVTIWLKRSGVWYSKDFLISVMQ